MTSEKLDAERPGCRECGADKYHAFACSLPVVERDGPDCPVLDSERKDFGRMAQATAEESLEPQKFYVITHGASQSYISTVHTEDCPMFKRFKHARVRDRDPRIGDRFNNFHSCPLCTGKMQRKR